MKDIVLTLRETDPQGNVATSHEFQVSNETIEGFGGTLEGPWTLDAKKTGKLPQYFTFRQNMQHLMSLWNTLLADNCHSKTLPPA